MTPIAVRTSQSERWWSLLSPDSMVKNLWSHRELIRQFHARYVAQKYRGTYLGLLWTVAQPLLTLGVYTLMFATVFKMKWDNLATENSTASYALNFFCGYTTFHMFSDMMNQSTASVSSSSNLVRRVVFPVEILPLVGVGQHLVYKLVGYGLLLIAALVIVGTVQPTVPLIFVVMVPLLLITLGMSWILAMVGVYVQDVRQVVMVLTQLLFYLTPIFYPPSRVPEDFRGLLSLNPLSSIVDNSRRVLLEGQMPDWHAWCWTTLLGLVLVIVGYAVFEKGKRGFADVL